MSEASRARLKGSVRIARAILAIATLIDSFSWMVLVRTWYESSDAAMHASCILWFIMSVSDTYMIDGSMDRWKSPPDRHTHTWIDFRAMPRCERQLLLCGQSALAWSIWEPSVKCTVVLPGSHSIGIFRMAYLLARWFSPGCVWRYHHLPYISNHITGTTGWSLV